MVTIIAALDEENGIGKNNDIPWSEPLDLSWFKFMTSGHKIVMGRKTYESIGFPLPNRDNIVLTRNREFAVKEEHYWDVEIYYDVQNLIHTLNSFSDNNLYIIGGSSIYEQFLPYTDVLLLTRIRGTHECDTFFPEYEESFHKVAEFVVPSSELVFQKWV